LTQSLFVFLRLVWLKTSKLGVNFTSKLKSLSLRLSEQVKKLLPLVKNFMAFGISYLGSLVLNQSLKLQSLLAKVKNLITLQLMKLKSKSKS